MDVPRRHAGLQASEVALAKIDGSDAEVLAASGVEEARDRMDMLESELKTAGSPGAAR